MEGVPTKILGRATLNGTMPNKSVSHTLISLSFYKTVEAQIGHNFKNVSRLKFS